MSNYMDMKTDIIAQTDNFIVWKADEPDGETTYHLEVNNITFSWKNGKSSLNSRNSLLVSQKVRPVCLRIRIQTW